ncbi:MAG TPA: hypothetical protein VM489_10650 [Burkholderiales bacterium]|nr:hypothetical protein [Burkholderiales bacterium]
MDEEIRYRVCPQRNVAAAFQRFIGPDSGGLERFFDSPLERERFFGRAWPVRTVAVESMREATQELLVPGARALRRRARDAALAALAWALGVALWAYKYERGQTPRRGLTPISVSFLRRFQTAFPL